MNYQTFISNVKEEIDNLLDTTMTASIQSTLKNNGKERIGITITNLDTNIFPTIYLEEFYSQYLNGRCITDIAANIMHLYHEVKFEEEWDIEQITSFSHAKSKLVYKLIHFDKNKSLLQDIPFIPFHDLAITFYLLLENTPNGCASILVSNSLQNTWNIDLSELYQIASQNTPKLLPAELLPIHTLIHEFQEALITDEVFHKTPMFVLTNNYRHLGAACILYNRVLEDIGNQLNEDFFILPSSIHETIILPATSSSKIENLNQMITVINQTQVCEEEVLSDHAYYYNREKRKLLIAED